MLSNNRMSGDPHVEGPDTLDTGTDSAWMRRHFSDSIYIWACGEKPNDEDDDPKVSDRLFGWLILLMQAFAYTMLIFLARATSAVDTDSSSGNSDESGHLLPSVTGAMYLLVASTTHDLRACYSLVVGGKCAGHRAFGTGLLIVYGITISAAMTVLVSTSADSTSVLLNAVTVIFVADLDEKSLNVLETVPQKWRLVWAIESIGISFALALVAIVYMGESSSLLEMNNGILQTFPTWFVWGTNPMAITLSAVIVSSIVHAVCDVCDRASEACQVGDEFKFRLLFENVFEGVCVRIKVVKERVVREPCFYGALAVWFAQGLAVWSLLNGGYGNLTGVVFIPATSASTHGSWVINEKKTALVFGNVVLVAGLAIKVVSAVKARCKRVTALSRRRVSSVEIGSAERGSSREGARTSSLLMGWGIGYWSTSLIHVLCCAWHGGECGWNAPMALRGVAYACAPVFYVAVIFTVADINFLGTRFGDFVKPAVTRMTDTSTVEYWIITSVLRDIFVFWLGVCSSLRWDFVYDF